MFINRLYFNKGGDTMRFEFNEDEIKEELNRVYIEEDDVLLIGEFIEGEGKDYVLTGSAVIDGETYHDFETEFELVEEINPQSAGDIMKAEWDWCDYIC